MHAGHRLDEVDLPQPFSPTRQWISPALTSQSMLFERTHASETFGESSEAQKRHGIISHSANSRCAMNGRE